jgi:hypothetical protein
VGQSFWKNAPRDQSAGVEVVSLPGTKIAAAGRLVSPRYWAYFEQASGLKLGAA